ncbi:MAG: bifunctional diguanylate cyclase/phosphodiesterase [Acidimicrobiales bacterium]
MAAAARVQAEDLARAAGTRRAHGPAGPPMVIDATRSLLEQQGLLGGFTCVVHLDVNAFKEVNDTLGHEVGDALICLLGDRVVAACPRGGMVGRPGGDEFLVLAPANGPQDCIDMVMMLLAAIRRPVHLIGNELRVTASAGVATTASSHLEAEALVRNAEIAMYQAKELGPDGFQVYEEELREGLLDRVERKSALRTGLRRREFVPWYQPEVSIATGEIVGLEALARWQRGGGRPAETAAPFIELAEQTGLIGELGRAMLDQVCMQVRDWQESLGLTPPRIWINLSASQLVVPGTADAVLATLDRYGLAPDVLGVEITETALLSDAAVGIAALDHLSRAGVNIAVDDFGTGYSSLTYVKSHHVDVLKIDASFVRGLPNDPEDVAIVSASVALGSSLGMRIVAEGVETTAQLEAARNLGCTEAQGFLFTPALSGDKVAMLLQAQPWRQG